MALLFETTASPDLFREPFVAPRDVSICGKKATQLGWITNAQGRRLFAEIVYGTSFVALDRIEDVSRAISR